MSLEGIKDSATTGLSIQEKALYVSSQNISRSSEDGYNRLKLGITSQDSIVCIGRIGEEIDSYLNNEIRKQISIASYTDKKDEYLEKVINIFGSPNTSFDRIPDNAEYNLTEAIGRFFASINSLSSAPENLAQKQDVIMKAEEISYLLSSTIQKLDNLSNEIKSEIEIATENINNQINQIYKINQKIPMLTEDTELLSNLNMQRNYAINDIASYMDLVTYNEPFGKIHIITPNGITLVDRVKRELEYVTEPDDYMSLNAKTTEYTKASHQIFNEKDNNFHQLGSGSIRAMLEVRNIHIPEMKERLISFAETLKNNFNSIIHGATPYPGEKLLTSKHNFFPSNGEMSFDGIIKIAPIKDDGKVVTDYMLNPIKTLTLDISEFKNTNDLIREINSYFTTQNSRAEVTEKLSNISLYTKSITEDYFSIGIDSDSISEEKILLDFDTITITYKDPTSGEIKTFSKYDEGNHCVLEPNERRIFELIPSLDKNKLPAASEFHIKINFRIDGMNYSAGYDLDLTNIEKKLRTGASDITGAKSKFLRENPVHYVKAIISDGDAEQTSLEEGFFQLTSPVKNVNIVINRVGEPGANDFLDALAFNDFFETISTENGNFKKLQVTEHFQNHPSYFPTTIMTDSPIPSLGMGGNKIITELGLLTEKNFQFFGTEKAQTSNTLIQYISLTIEHAANNSIAASHENKREQHTKEVYENQKSAISGVNIEEEIQHMMNIKYMYNACTHVLSALKEMYSFLMEAM